MASKARLAELYKLRCGVFNRVYNPDNVRMGLEVLQAPLRGPEVTDYYYPSLKLVPTPAQLSKMHPGLRFYDPDEQYRIDKIERMKKKGKGAPKKANEKKDVKKK